MTSVLFAVLLVLSGAAPAGKPSATLVRHDENVADQPPMRLVSADDLASLCRTLEPAERVRPKGDAVERGEAEARQDSERDTTLRRRYEVLVTAGKIAFAPYDGPERTLALQEPAQIPVAGGTARLWPTEQRDLAVEADPAAARRVLQAQRKGTLLLSLLFALPDDATCGRGAAGKKFTIPVEPISWRWLDGAVELARGGAAAERPLVTAAQGAKPTVDVGDPIAGPSEAKKAVLARAADLQACYVEALKRDPAIDGVLVADLGGAKPAISADSVGDADLAACVQKVLTPLAPSQGRSAVPIRFELAPPGEVRSRR